MAEFNPYEPRRLLGIVGRLPRRSSFLSKMFFKRMIPPSGAKKIAFDQDTATKGIALYCHPLVDGKPVRERGFVTREIEPAYVKPWMNFDPVRVLDRIIGEDFSGPLTPNVRRQANLTRGYADLMQIIGTRLEQQAYEGLMTGQQVISGEGIPEPIIVSYGRLSSLTKTLTTTARWGEAGVSPLDDIVDWIRELAAVNGMSPNRVVLGPMASEYLRNDPKFEKLINQDYKRQTPGTQFDAVVLDEPINGLLIGVLKAAGGSVELWEYQQTYEDETGAAQKIMGDHSVIIGYESTELTQTQCFGTVIDPELNYESSLLTDPTTQAVMHIAPWHAFKQKPAVGEMIGIMSAPLMALTEKDANLVVTVR
jgi:hypothetical protein